MNTRRRLLIALGTSAFAASLASLAQQQQRKIYRLGMLGTGSESTPALETFARALRELGYVEGKNILIERRFAQGNFERLPALAMELAARKVDVIYASNTPSVEAARQVVGTIPIVFAGASDPIGSGFVASLARPGGNITGISIISPELSAKRLQILKETFPKTSRVAVFGSDEPVVALQLTEVGRAAGRLGVEIIPSKITSRNDFEQAIVLLRKRHAEAIYFLESPTNAFNGKLLAEFAAKARLPALYGNLTSVNVGGLMGYGPNLEALYGRAAGYVDKILKGAKPADLPVEQPTKFDLILNLKTAKALGIKIPQSILVRADKVIE